MTLFNTSACIWLATMHLSPTNEKLWVNKWLKIELKQANMTHLLNNILTDQLLLSFKFFCFQFCLIVKACGGIIFPRCTFFGLLLTEWPMTTVQPQSTYPLKKTLSCHSFYWADCRSRFIKISPCKYLPCFKFLRPFKAKIYWSYRIYKRTCSG